MTESARGFEPHRRYLTGLAYRMLGSLSEAEDIVQEAYLRWHASDRTAVANARGFLARTVTRLCLDHLKSARVRREQYVGPWLPEPLLEETMPAVDAVHEQAEDLSIALLLALERLSPLERAAFLLHDLFDLDFLEVSQTIGRSEAACRQLAARARAHVRAARPRFVVPAEEGERIVHAFLTATATGDLEALSSLLAEGAVLHSDGGGKKLAARNLIHGQDRVARFFIGVGRKSRTAGGTRIRPARINGLPGFLMTEPDGTLETAAFEVAHGRITAIYVVRNPEKLRHVRF